MVREEKREAKAQKCDRQHIRERALTQADTALDNAKHARPSLTLNAQSLAGWDPAIRSSQRSLDAARSVGALDPRLSERLATLVNDQKRFVNTLKLQSRHLDDLDDAARIPVCRSILAWRKAEVWHDALHDCPLSETQPEAEVDPPAEEPADPEP